MQPYASVQDLVNRFGEQEVIELTDRDHTGELVEDVAETALTDSFAEIDSYVQSRYTLPLPSVPDVLRRVACDIARYRLYGARPTEEARQRYDDALKFLRDVANGTINLGVTPPPSGGVAQVTGPPRVFPRSDLKDFG